MMKLIVLVALIGAAAAQNRPRPNPNPNPSQRSEDITILRSESENNGDGVYSFSYETSDGTSAAQKGYTKPAPPGGEFETLQVQEGYFQYVSPEGETYKVDYLADENGFQPRADHLPTSPPIPEEIARALEIIYKNAGDQRASASNTQPQRPRPAATRQF